MLELEFGAQENSDMQYAKTFVTWFLFAAGLLVSGFIAIESLRDYYSGSVSDDAFLLFFSMFAISGGIFFGLLAVVIYRVINLSGKLDSILLRGPELIRRAEQLGVSLKKIHDSNAHLQEPELQRRVLEAEKALRERKLVVLSLTSATVSALGALAAWIAVAIRLNS